MDTLYLIIWQRGPPVSNYRHLAGGAWPWLDTRRCLPAACGARRGLQRQAGPRRSARRFSHAVQCCLAPAPSSAAESPLQDSDRAPTSLPAHRDRISESAAQDSVRLRVVPEDSDSGFEKLETRGVGGDMVCCR